MLESLLYKTEYRVGQHIVLNIPTLGDIIDAEDAYYRTLDLFTAMPIDFMVQLDDLGIDFSEINEWQLFLLLLESSRARNLGNGVRSDILFQNIDLNEFQIAQRDGSEEIVLVNVKTGFEIDERLYYHISEAVCQIFGREKNIRRPANVEAKKFMIEIERKKQKRLRRKKHKSELETLIVALVNAEQFKYDFETVRNLTIYQFNESAKQIVHKVDFDNRMIGVYSGTLDAKTLSQDDLNWLVHNS